MGRGKLAEYVGNFVSTYAGISEPYFAMPRRGNAHLNKALESLKPSASANTASRALAVESAFTAALRRANMARYRSNRCLEVSSSVVRRESTGSFSSARAAGAGSTVGKLGLRESGVSSANEEC